MNVPGAKRTTALTLIEVLAIIGVLVFLAFLLLPPPCGNKAPAARIACANNLKQIGLAFKVWSGDCNDRYQMEISVTNGGTKEWVESGVVWRHFQVMSNELNTPKILFCPTDTDPYRKQANAFSISGSNIPQEMVPFTGDSNTSYFIGVDAKDVMPTMPLAGDRNITLSNFALRAGLHALPTNVPIGWSDAMHKRQGNILFVDGSMQGINSAQLPSSFQASGVATNRLAVP